MRDQTQPGVLPLRPLTTGEVLDAGVVLLRAQGGRLIGWGVAFALIEQLIVFPLRRLADLDGRLMPDENALANYGILIVIGLGTEAFVIAMLGALAGRDAPRILLGPDAAPLPRSRLLPAAVASLVAAIFCAGAGWAFLVLPVPLQWLGLILSFLLTALCWPIAYGLLGLTATAAVIDRRNPGAALIRSLRLTTATMTRGVWIRLIGYVAWLMIRLGLAIAVIAIVEIFFVSPSNTVDNLLLGGAFLLVNALAYPMLGCLDVALHLETRMRTEGLDLSLSRTLRRGVSSEAALAVPVKVAR